MSDKFKNKYRIPSARLPHWDYGWNAMYFITICTQNRIHYFGNIDHGKMNLSEIGKITESEWLKTFEIRADMNLEMGEFVVMPNHFHAVIGIGENQFNTGNGYDDHASCRDAMQRRDAMHCVSTPATTPIPTPPLTPKNQFGPQSKNLASIIRGFKSSVKKYATINKIDFVWQPRYHDHIIRNDKSFQRISEYIINNPLNWKEDRFFK